MRQQIHKSKGQEKELLWGLDGVAPPSRSRVKKPMPALGQGKLLEKERYKKGKNTTAGFPSSFCCPAPLHHQQRDNKLKDLVLSVNQGPASISV